MSRHGSDNFDYETARDDLFDAGLDPDYLSSYDHEKRDKYLRKNGFDPDDYSGHKKSGSSSSSFFDDDDSDEGCFLTTACIVAKGLADNCDELQTLRSYRDGYLLSREGGREDVAEYYAIAPQIVKKNDALPGAKARWTALYDSLVSPCVAFIREGDNEAAYRLYKETTLSLKNEYLK